MTENGFALAVAKAEHFLPDTIALVKEVAQFILDAQRAFHAGHIEAKGQGNLVSYVDRESERMLVQGLGRILPGSGIIGEEGSNIDSGSEYRWIIDPLDGTTNFMHGVPHYAISVALQFREQTILGIVEDVAGRETYHGIRTKGAWANGIPIRVSETRGLEHSLLCMGFPYPDSDFVLDDYLAVLKEFVGASRGMRRMGAAALDLAWVACGKFDGFYEWGLQPWDVAAAALILQEAGGHATDFAGTDNFVFGRQIVASNASIHDAMLDIIRKHYRG